MKTESNGTLHVSNGASLPHSLSHSANSVKSLKEQEAMLPMSKSTSNNKLKQKETIVSISPGAKGCYFTRLQVAIFAIAFVLSLALVLFLLLFLGRKTPNFGSRFHETPDTCPCLISHMTHVDQAVVDETPERPSTGETFQSSDAPALDIRLPRDLVPVHYDLDLKIILNNTSGSSETYSGNVNISMYVQESTRFIILHVKPIYIDIATDDVTVTLNSNEIVEVKDEKKKTKRKGLLKRESLIYEESKGKGSSKNDSSWKQKMQVHVVDTNHDIVRQYYEYDKELYIIELKKALVQGYNYTARIGHFRGLIFGDLKGLYLSSYKDHNGDRRYLVASQLQSTDARKVFPCFDEPDMKATFAVSITHLAEFTALGNMPIKSQECIDDCRLIKVTFQTTPRMSTYILAFVVSDFKYTENVLENNYVLRIWSQPDMVNQTKYALSYASRAYEYFTDYFQLPDVVPKADHVAVPDFSGGAMENWGLVVYRETALLYDPDVSSSPNKFMVSLIVAHEIAHTWFGNMVTMKWWDDLWLNEGFASTLMYFAMDHIHPVWNVFQIYVVEDMFPVMVKDALETSHPVSPQLSHPDEIAEAFDQISYNKGMAILRMLCSFVGEDGFRKGLQMYVTKYKFGNAEMSELWQTFTEAGNGSFNIGEIMDTWTRQMGYPVVTVSVEGDYYVLEQKRFLYNSNISTGLDESLYGYKWHVPFTYMLEGDTAPRLQWLRMGPDKIKKTTNGWLIGNIRYAGFYRVQYDVTMWSQLAHQLNIDHTVFDGANRAGLIDDSFNLARASQLDYGVALNLTTYLSHEDNYVPWKAFLSCLEFIRGMLSKQNAYVLLEKYIRELVAPVFTKIGTAERGTLPEMYLRGLLLRTGCDIGVKSAIKFARDRFIDWMSNGTRLPTDYAQVIYSVGVREGSVEEWDYVWKRSQATNVPAEREMMLEALAQTQKPWLLWRYANWIFDKSKIKMQDVGPVMSYFSRAPLGRMIALHFLMNRWNELNDKFGEDTFIIREMIGGVTTYVNSEFELRQLVLLFSENPPKGAKKGADNALELIRNNIKWMGEHYASIEEWLNQHVASTI